MYKLGNLDVGHFNVNFRHYNIVSGGKGVDEDTTRNRMAQEIIIII